MALASIVKLDAPSNIVGLAHGAKAANIVQMGRAGLPIPPGFCIPGTVCRQHLRAAGILLQLTTALPELEDAAPHEKRKILAEIRKRIADAPLENGLGDRIAEHFRTLNAESVAVRSSATAEDLPHQSFAGQYDTFLNITSLNACIESVKKCWASLWTERAFDYRCQNGVDHIDVEMAVIVQEMIDADVSGIIFTADPLTGARDKIIIEAARGLGEHIVRGKVPADRCVLKKSHLKITEYKPAEPDTAPCIDHTTAKHLARLAVKVESHFSSPQDIEWSIKDRQMWLLQTRPITALPEAVEEVAENRGMWSHFPAQEVLPDVVTPATKSLLDSFTEPLLQPIFEMLCIDRGGHPIFGYIAGRAYFNGSLILAAINAMPGSDAIDFSESAGSDPDLKRIIEFAKETEPKDLPEIRFHKLRFFLKLPLLAGRFLLAGQRKGQAFMANAIACNRRFTLADPAAMTNEQILEFCSKLADQIRQFCSGIILLFDVFAAFPALKVLCRRWFDEPTRASQLVAGLGNMTDAEAALDLWKLAKIVDNLPELKERILEKTPWQTIYTDLPDIPNVKTFLAAWNEFMRDHGHHCRAEIELINPRWCERPDYILSIIRGYLESIGKADPVEKHQETADERFRLEKDCRDSLKNPIKRWLFGRILRKAQTGSLWRENIKSELVKIIAVMRKTLLELARRLVANGTLEDPDDIFFLKLEESSAIAQGRVDFDIKQLIADRRAECEKWEAITPPNTVIGKFIPEDYTPDPVKRNGEMLKGLSLSHGIATGKAKVILRADTDQHIRAGEILVAPFTDPGWTPYFIPAAAVVTEHGGLLSHGAIVARELAIPAVTNVGPATKIIKTGQTIQVDGNTGTVTIIE